MNTAYCNRKLFRTRALARVKHSSGSCAKNTLPCIHSFHECFRRRILKPMDGIVVSLMQSLQPAGELCLPAVVDDVRHRLPLSGGVRIDTGQTEPCPNDGGWHGRYRGLSGTGSEGFTVDEVDQSQVVGRQGQALGHG